MTIQAKFEKWKSLDLLDKAMETVIELKEEFVRANKAQMYRGQNKLGKNMNPYKYDSYARYKNGINGTPPMGIRDNYLTGDFYSGFELKQVGKTSYEITSVDDKTSILEKWAGGDIFGLNSQSKDEIKDEFQVSLIKRIKDATS